MWVKNINDATLYWVIIKTLIVIKWLEPSYPLRYSPEIRIINNISVYQNCFVTLRSQINMQAGILAKNR